MTSAPEIEKAKAFATRKHNGQKGKGPEQAYIDHLEAVVRLLKDHGEERAEVLAAAYLHDCLEKTDTTVGELIREFGGDIAELVYWLTDPEDSEGPEKELLSAWLLSRAPEKAQFIKLADIIDNALPFAGTIRAGGLSFAPARAQFSSGWPPLRMAGLSGYSCSWMHALR
jgi:(p)ppGpp synthase/HD superfamily hydrolase